MMTQTSDDQAQGRIILGAVTKLSPHMHTELVIDALDDQGHVLDQLIGFAFDTLGVRVLDLRIVPPSMSSPQYPALLQHL